MSTTGRAFSVVILAAGESKRYGSPKQLTGFFGEPLLAYVIKKVAACGIKPYIALGANYDLISNHVEMESYKKRFILIKNWKFGLSESIKESLKFLGCQSDHGVAFVLGDQPLIDVAYLMRFYSRVESNSTSLLGTAYQGERNLGVPAYFPRQYFAELLSLSGDQGAKKVLNAHNADFLEYDGELLDIDEPEDLAQAIGLLQKKRQKLN